MIGGSGTVWFIYRDHFLRQQKIAANKKAVFFVLATSITYFVRTLLSETVGGPFGLGFRCNCNFTDGNVKHAFSEPEQLSIRLFGGALLAVAFVRVLVYWFVFRRYSPSWGMQMLTLRRAF